MNHMKTRMIQAKSILTKQESGFLSTGPFPFTHTLNAYTGCSFGGTACGSYCYAPSLPNWTNADLSVDTKWGEHVFVKKNAADVLAETLASMKPETRQGLRIFMSPATDPYQPIEQQHEITRSILEVFSRYSDLGLLVIQTRSNLVHRDFDIISKLPYVWLSMTVETDDETILRELGPVGIRPQVRMDTLLAARYNGIHTQLTVSPSLPYSYDFPNKILKTKVDRVIVDTFTEGDGSRGVRTAHSPIAKLAKWDWKNDRDAKLLFDRLQKEMGRSNVGWSSAGFCSIPSQVIEKNIQTSMF